MDRSLREVSDRQWQELRIMLTAHAQSLLRKHFWKARRSMAVPGGADAEDFAMGAISDVLTGTRAWDADKYPDLGAHLRWVVRSKVSNALSCSENAQRGEMPDEAPAKQDTTATDDAFLWAQYDALDDDPVSQKVLECIIDGCETRSDIAACARITPDEMDNARKRLRRRLSASGFAVEAHAKPQGRKAQGAQ